MNSQHPILYVEDEETDVFLMRVALKKAALPVSLCVAIHGVQAIDYLAGKGPFADRAIHPLPGLVLLDLNLPLKSGFDVLQWIREQPAYASLPVVIYSSSNADGDRAKARHLGASDYLVKTSNLNDLATLIRTLLVRWFPPPQQQ